MKRAAAIILSLMLMWLQVLASAPTLSAAAPPPPECSCCTGKKVCCCIEQTSSDAIPLPVAPAPASATIDFHAVLSRVVAWTLPAAVPTVVYSSSASSELAPAVPLFQRNCALLI